MSDQEQVKKDISSIVALINKKAAFGGRLFVKDLPLEVCKAISEQGLSNSGYKILVVSNEKEQRSEILAARASVDTVFLYASDSCVNIMPEITSTTEWIALPKALSKRLS